MTNRLLKRQKKRSAKVAQQKIEYLAAAFLKETGLQPSKARLCQSHGLNDAGTPTAYYWFEELTERANIADTHPDVQFMFDALFAFNEVFKGKTAADEPQQFAEFQTMVADFMQKYADASATPILTGQRNAGSPIPEEEATAQEATGSGPTDQLGDGVQG